DERLKVYATGIYAVFDVFGTTPKGGRFFDGTGWEPPGDYVMHDRPWYKAAVEADGKIGVTEPYIALAWDKYTITFARRIFDNEGNSLGIVCLDILLDRVRNYAVNTYFAEGGYGLLLNKNLEMLAHPDSDLWGKPLGEIQNFLSIVDDLRNNRQVTERKIRNYKNEKSVISFRQLPNGWHIGIVIQEKIYFRDLTIMRIALMTAGIILAAIFIFILLRLSAVRKELADYKGEGGLTDREQEIYALLLKGMSHKDIAYALKITFSTVNFHRSNLYRKLGVQSKAELFSKYNSSQN
ncbi:MAG: LuxR C-terminal-related transcriptional regulator, partial [Treponema sp.]|nr:LuxR C-terminal-related transcriptional regulator [Treponema sp.]